ncbi:MAG: hypothetical protein IKA64_01900 [Clostridia bacterium]|nr:hypothetical protein [Clostridia bacterium]
MANNFSDVKEIHNDYLKRNGVQALSDRPNEQQKYGESGLTAAELKAWFDKSSAMLISKFNEILTRLKELSSSDIPYTIYDSGNPSSETVRSKLDGVSSEIHYKYFYGPASRVGKGLCEWIEDLDMLLSRLPLEDVTSDNALALFGAQAGVKGYYWSEIDFLTRQIRVSEKQVNPPTDDTGSPLFNTPLSDVNPHDDICRYNVGDVISIINGSKFIDCLTITEKDGDVLTFDKDFPFSEIKGGDGFDDSTIFCLARPDVGAVDLGMNAVGIGPGSAALAYLALAIGRECTAKSQYGVALNRGTVAGYAALAINRLCEALGDNSFSGGHNSSANHNTAYSWGRDVHTGFQYQHVIGMFNEILERSVALIVGNGSSDTARSNALVLEWIGHLKLANRITMGALPEDEMDALNYGQFLDYILEAEEKYAKKTDLAKIYRPCGTISDISLFPEDAEVGDVYDIASEFELGGANYPAGTNVVKTENGLDALSGKIDLSKYLELPEAANAYRVPFFYPKSNVPRWMRVSAMASADTIAQHGNNGEFIVRENPSIPNEAVPLSYVNGIHSALNEQMQSLADKIPESTAKYVYQHNFYIELSSNDDNCYWFNGVFSILHSSEASLALTLTDLYNLILPMGPINFNGYCESVDPVDVGPPMALRATAEHLEIGTGAPGGPLWMWKVPVAGFSEWNFSYTDTVVKVEVK